MRSVKPNKKKMKYKTCSLLTIPGLLQAEKLKANGWQVNSVGLFSIQFCKKEGDRLSAKEAKESLSLNSNH